MPSAHVTQSAKNWEKPFSRGNSIAIWIKQFLENKSPFLCGWIGHFQNKKINIFNYLEIGFRSHNFLNSNQLVNFVDIFFQNEEMREVRM